MSLLDALVRAADWHAAAFTVVALENSPSSVDNTFLEHLQAEVVAADERLEASLSDFLDAKMLWRGGVAYYDEEERDWRSLRGFELLAPDESALDVDVLRIGRRLKERIGKPLR